MGESDLEVIAGIGAANGAQPHSSDASVIGPGLGILVPETGGPTVPGPVLPGPGQDPGEDPGEPEDEDDPPPKPPPPEPPPPPPPPPTLGDARCYVGWQDFSKTRTLCRCNHPNGASDQCLIRWRDRADPYHVAYWTVPPMAMGMSSWFQVLQGVLDTRNWKQGSPPNNLQSFTRVRRVAGVPIPPTMRGCANLFDVQNFPMPAFLQKPGSFMAPGGAGGLLRHPYYKPYSFVEAYNLGGTCVMGLPGATDSTWSVAIDVELRPAWNGDRCEDIYLEAMSIVQSRAPSREDGTAHYTAYQFFLENALYGVARLFDIYHESVTLCPPEFQDPSFVAAMSCAIAEQTLEAFALWSTNGKHSDPLWREFFERFPDRVLLLEPAYRLKGLARLDPKWRAINFALWLDQMLFLKGSGAAFGRAHVIPGVRRLVRSGFPELLDGACFLDCARIVSILTREFRLRLDLLGGTDPIDIEVAVGPFQFNLLTTLAEGLEAGGTTSARTCAAGLRRLAQRMGLK